MKIANFKIRTILGDRNRLGILTEKGVIDVNNVMTLYYQKKNWFNAIEKANLNAPSSLSSFIKISENVLDDLQVIESLFFDYIKNGDIETLHGAPLLFDTDNIKFDCPIDKINCYRDFYIHEKHVQKGFEKRGEEIPKPWYEMPAYYKGPTSGFLGDGDTIPWPSYTKKLDYELELGCIITKDGFNIKAEDAYDHILGFTVFNDISARDIQKKEMAVRLGPAKGKDFASIVGPVITTIDEFNYADPSLKMTAKINGELWSEGMSSDGNYSWAEMIEHASKEEWLIGSDFLGSGTVGTGCGLELDKWIKPGDKVELEIEKIGKLTNIVGKPNKE